MPFDDGWQTDNALGDLNAPLINLERMQPRFLLAQGPMRGRDRVARPCGPADHRRRRRAGHLRGHQGADVSTRSVAPPQRWAPSGHRPRPGRSAANSPPPTTSRCTTSRWIRRCPLRRDQSPRISTDTGYPHGRLAGQGPARAGQPDRRHGRWQRQRLRGLGGFRAHARRDDPDLRAFRIDPNLAWGNQLITSDVQGGYYRADYQRRRWLADFGVDEVKSVSGNGSNTTFVNADARYQLSRDIGVGGVANVRHSDRQYRLVAGRLLRQCQLRAAPGAHRSTTPPTRRPRMRR